ncbi:unnamed protein product [Tilletia controversa]|uniref:Small ribosomal subunit protein bS18m n=2 Tax=Tilletia TaxID=13289 RepID=A0A177UEK3_9BASI|nr:hypothetical protein CF336_g5411 [Tilletia laevis]KAE8256744.1 hypothetical protein A4X03_0g5099 [Tilletia caries]CAD6935643.1 unnamed protein product [Tilletia controversa]KAE8195867.1 hypothetical protein CF335_g4992 [Tilletia laevis]CAD6892940.1 unnamed protein product [Tilletia caries]
MAFSLPALALRRSAVAAATASCSRVASAPLSALSLAVTSSRQHPRLFANRSFTTSALLSEDKNTGRPSGSGSPSSSASGRSSLPARSSSSSASGASSFPARKTPAKAPAPARKELFSVFNPSARAQLVAERIATGGAPKDSSASSSEGAEEGAAEQGEPESEEPGSTPGSASPAGGSPSPLAAQKPNRNYLHGQLIAPTAFTPLSQAGESTEQARSRFRARPLLGPSASLAKRLDPFYKLGLNPSKPSLQDDSYKNPSLLTPFVSDLGRILPRNRTGLTRKGQRQVGKAIRRARAMGLVAIFNRGTGRKSGYLWR